MCSAAHQTSSQTTQRELVLRNAPTATLVKNKTVPASSPARLLTPISQIRHRICVSMCARFCPPSPTATGKPEPVYPAAQVLTSPSPTQPPTSARLPALKRQSLTTGTPLLRSALLSAPTLQTFTLQILSHSIVCLSALKSHSLTGISRREHAFLFVWDPYLPMIRPGSACRQLAARQDTLPITPLGPVWPSAH